uniref:Uncharacterized protein n=1 Tax=Rhizophora mucronata TaxID=61149 RepID=A0A2P2PVW1_RHIMU
MRIWLCLKNIFLPFG